MDERSGPRTIYRVAPGRSVTFQGRVLVAGTIVSREQVYRPEFAGRVIAETEPGYVSRDVGTRGAVAGDDE